MTKDYKHLETKLIHTGEPEPLIGGAVSMPIFQSVTMSTLVRLLITISNTFV
jgi:hypothetical protein